VNADVALGCDDTINVAMTDPRTGWGWPIELPLGEILGAAWADQDIATRLDALTRQWEARRPAHPLTPGQQSGTYPTPGQLMWQDHEILSDLTFTVTDSPDWLEIAASIKADSHAGAASPSWLVQLSLEVACWCPTDHNLHAVQVDQRLAGTPHVALDQFAELLALRDHWLNMSCDPSWWRTRHGLPQPS